MKTQIKKKHIGEDIKSYLKRHDILQVNVCKRLGISTTIFNEILSGKRSLSIDIAHKMEDNFLGKAKTWFTRQLEYDCYNYKVNKIAKEKQKNVSK